MLLNAEREFEPESLPPQNPFELCLTASAPQEYFSLNWLVSCPYKRDACRPTVVSLRLAPKGFPFGARAHILDDHLSNEGDVGATKRFELLLAPYSRHGNGRDLS